MRTIDQIKQDIQEEKDVSVDEWVFRLEKSRNGANVHSVNKAIFYLHYLSDDGHRFAKGKNFDRLGLFIDVVHCALKYGEWQKLNEYMGGWF